MLRQIKTNSGTLKVAKNHAVAYEVFALRSFKSTTYKCECGWSTKANGQGRGYKVFASIHLSA
jgi:hypothetical protein